ncbi:MAG: zinc ABC transporter substrate-binding protein [Coleofasciculaceae cyanobacterium]
MLKLIQPQSLWTSTIMVLAVGLTNCGQSNNSNEIGTAMVSEGDKPTVVASYSILCDFTETIAQETVDLNCLIEPGQSPHAYKTTPSDRQVMERAQLILYGGYEFEPNMIGLVKATNTPAPKVAVHEEAVTQPILGHHHHEEEEEEHGRDHEATEHYEDEKEPDSHVWLNVQNAVAMVEVIKEHLVEVNPEKAQLYTDNSQKLQLQLQQLDNWVKEQVQTIPKGQRTIVTTHDALAYYTQAYGFETSDSLQGLSAEEVPTARQVKELVEKIETARVPTIFAEVTSNDKVIATVAREANAKLSEQELVVDGLGRKDSTTGTYIGMMVHNTCTIVEGLGGKCQSFPLPRVD